MGVKTLHCFVVSASICSYFSSGFGDSPPMFLCFQAGYVKRMVVVVGLALQMLLQSAVFWPRVFLHTGAASQLGTSNCSA